MLVLLVLALGAGLLRLIGELAALSLGLPLERRALLGGGRGPARTQLGDLALRRGAQLGRVRLALTVAAGATVPAGSVADVLSDPTSRWVTLTDAVNATASQATVTVEAEQETAGTLPAAATTISHIATPVAGWVSVTNLAAASPGIAADTDPVLRRRAETELQGVGTTPAEAIRAALLRVPLVAEVVVWENTSDLTDADSRPPHSVEAMVRGGDDNAIAAVLWATKARGIATHGSTSATVLDEQGREYLSRIRRNSQRMGELIDDLLELSRVSRAEVRRTLINLSDFARDIARELDAEAPERRVQWVIPEGLWVDADPGLARVVLENLLRNAWKFTRLQPQPRIELGQAPVGGQAGYCVRDNGAGFDMTYVGRLFAPFQRLHNNREFDGGGIGLAIVQRAIRLHGGQVSAGQGPGMRIVIALPQPALPPLPSK